MVNPRRQKPRGGSVAKPGTPLLFSSKSDIKEVYGDLSNPFLKRSPWQKHPREMNKCKNSIPYINHFMVFKYCQHPVQDTKCCPERVAHDTCIGHSRLFPCLYAPFVRLYIVVRQGSSAKVTPPMSKISEYKAHTPSVRHINMNYIQQHNSCQYPNQTRGHPEETRFPP